MLVFLDLRIFLQFLVLLQILFHGEYHLFQHFFELFHLLITHILFFVEPGFKSVQSGIVEACRLDEDLGPALVFILGDVLLLLNMVQLIIIFFKVAGTNELYFLNLLLLPLFHDGPLFVHVVDLAPELIIHFIGCFFKSTSEFGFL